ncbi:MAG: helix-turn-helix domain-containing protein [Desulfobacterales bacterium]|nr:helix-turn-helix domain-containing protein [Desulfobacterales bacterium]
MEKFYTQTEVAKMFRCSKGTIIDWGKDGCFDIWRSPRNGRVLYSVESVERFYEEYLEKGTKKVAPKSRKAPDKVKSDFRVPTNIYLKRRKDGKET